MAYQLTFLHIPTHRQHWPVSNQDHLSRYKDSHSKDKMVVRLFYIHNGYSYTCKWYLNTETACWSYMLPFCSTRSLIPYWWVRAKRDVTPLLMQWSFFFFFCTHPLIWISGTDVTLISTEIPLLTDTLSKALWGQPQTALLLRDQVWWRVGHLLC